MATAFFAHESIVQDYSSIIQANSNYNTAIENKSKALDALRPELIDNPLYVNFAEKEREMYSAYDEVQKEYNKIKFLEFNSFQQFMGEFGWALGLFIYALFNLIKSFIRKTNTIFGEITLHSTILFISIFYLRWCFKHEDFSNIEYILTNIVTALALMVSCYYFVKVKDNYMSGLKASVRSLFDFIILHTYKVYIKDPDKIKYEKDYEELINKMP